MKTKLLILTLLFCSVSINAGTSQKSSSSEEKRTVIICTGKYAKRYHNSMCKGMNSCKGDKLKVSLSEAKKKGLTPCKWCY